jgi:DNA-binding NtrC family response regulator
MVLEAARILIVDDEIDFLETVVKRMRRRGIDTLQASSGEEALETIKKTPVDVVVLDVRMPGMDGTETLKAIKKHAPLTAVVMLTGHACVESAVAGMKNGAFDYLMKPVDLDTLCYMIEDAYQEKLLQERHRRFSDSKADTVARPGE